MLPVNPIKPHATVRCTRSAHSRPVTTTLSHVLTCAAFSRNLAARNLATFWAGVSVGWDGEGGADGEALGEELKVGRGAEEGVNVPAAARRMGVGEE